MLEDTGQKALWIAVAIAVVILAGGAAYQLQGARGGGSSQAGADAGTAAGDAGGPRFPASPASGQTSPAPPYPRPGPGLNLLALEPSPYLQLHARNPVDWYPWGEQAFARARATDRPVFLSVGYSTCYWCHVMERKVFSDPEIAAFMNRHFVSIKVDREERPDVDDLYMKATHLLTGSGGWPNSVFLTPEGEPFYAGTYFPPEDGYGRPGFPRVLSSLHQAWRGERQKVLDAAAQITGRLRQMARAGAGSGVAPPTAGQALRQALEDLQEDFDAEHGGFGRRNKFPRPPALELLLTAVEQGEQPEARRMLTQTLDAMALGGIYDHLGDGFHRYATEPTWSIPHFEKMLYDNAQLVGVYARAYALTGRPLYRRVVERTIAYLDREMSHPEGGFVSAQDAQVDGVEGASYVWTREQVEAVLGEARAEAFLEVYRIAPMPAHAEVEPPGAGVLRVRQPVRPLVEQSDAADAAALLARFDVDRAALLERRRKRPQPLRDDKVLAAWNGLAIRGLVQAADALGEPAYLERALRAARFVTQRLIAEDGALSRSYMAGQPREQGVLDDHAFLADAFLALARATGDPRWQTRARALADRMLARFRDAEHGGFFLAPEGSELLLRPKPFEDNAQPSGNGVALRVLQSLAEATGEPRYREAAAGTLRAAAPLLERAAYALPATVAALTTAPDAGAQQLAQAGSEPTPTQRTSQDEGEGFRLPRSQDHVKAELRPHPEDARALQVLLQIDPGWHVNANPASLAFLVPTAIELPDGAGEARARIGYPEGERFEPAFAAEAISVYEGQVAIPVHFEGDAEPPETLALRFQACDLERCLPPHRAELRLAARDGREEATP